ncbi:ABC transporter permease [Ponticoccus sp. SC2-23]|uniref:ABC transporter permease n=1 Tax=Alexandriicola marinus TaxID=2081710 RepID=UPI000FDB5867|nr:ABC transporter permease [Alexandriicola marinus]MBM1219175.1 ABC transporter permease [Ponticoccus sp. SC6-9]MBM1223753.1 ABC transporter permease [Ponticoccus sp. SC6-15]MBM1228989.1 ABC transporter permease [Ponticoccus sp. SC6-38]MBM1232719.1 ABC transporter permease [Ponticoccus sp. SC6-45]MBM1237331.1 ABC transporter permease [Ponticoccus sp. SC6-49]MBM1241730.1 ABC transporter permease [Ponticoccus sp. SC2-64]MBM1246243.1 ABC transporter permease [Ponticoccus sp. SC6-42]MBM1250721
MAVTDQVAGEGGGKPLMSIGMRRMINHAAIFLTLIALWEFGSRIGWLDPLFYPRPTAILESFWRIYVTQANVWHHLYVSLGLVFIGFAAGSILGVGLGALVGFNPVVRRFLQPYVIVLEATPRIAVAPLLIAALGFGAPPKIAIIMLVCFFAPFINTLSGVVNVNEEKLELFRSMGASKMQTLRKLVLPEAVPVIMAGERLALTAALSGVLVAEFILRDQGIGALILTYTRNLNMASAFACIFTLTIIGFLIFKGMEVLDHRIAFWNHSDATDRMSEKRARAWGNLTGGRNV